MTPVFSTLKCFTHRLTPVAHVGVSVRMSESCANSWWWDLLLSKKFYSRMLWKRAPAGHFLALTNDITGPNDKICILVWDYRRSWSHIAHCNISWHLFVISRCSILSARPHMRNAFGTTFL
jgi:hypothetical protein